MRTLRPLRVAREGDMSRVKDIRKCCAGRIRRAKDGERASFPAVNRGDRAATPRDIYRRRKRREESSDPLANRRSEFPRHPNPRAGSDLLPECRSRSLRRSRQQSVDRPRQSEEPRPAASTIAPSASHNPNPRAGTDPALERRSRSRRFSKSWSADRSRQSEAPRPAASTIALAGPARFRLQGFWRCRAWCTSHRPTRGQ